MYLGKYMTYVMSHDRRFWLEFLLFCTGHDLTFGSEPYGHQLQNSSSFIPGIRPIKPVFSAKSVAGGGGGACG